MLWKIKLKLNSLITYKFETYFSFFRPELEPLINESESFWKLANYGMLDDLSNRNLKSNLLNDLKNGIKPDLLPVKKKLISLLRSPSHAGAYQESYSTILK